MYSALLLKFKRSKNVNGKPELLQKRKWRKLEREGLLLSRNTHDPTVGSLRGKKESCSTRSGLRMGTGFVSFRQTLRGKGFSLLEFYSYLKCFSMFRLV